MERRHVIVAFGDILGFRSWTKRALNQPEVQNSFVLSFYKAMQAFSLESDSYVKYLGDGLMVLRELEAKEAFAEDAHQFVTEIVQLVKTVKGVIEASTYPKPQGFRARVVAGYVNKLDLPDPNDDHCTAKEYIGYAVNLSRCLLEISPLLPVLCHESVVELLGKKTKLHLVRLKERREHVRGIDNEDIEKLWVVRS